MKTQRTGRKKHAETGGREWLPYAALPVLVLMADLPAFSGGFVWDDDYPVTNNSTLLSLDGLRRIWLEPGAVPQLIEALRQRPNYAEAHNLMGRFLPERGHLDEAITTYSTALRLRPDHADASANLKEATTRNQQGRRATPSIRPNRASGDRD
jgi:tetratricopeptide (TPR) repeat protein